MDKEISEGAIGELGHYDVEFKGGFLVAKVDAQIPLGSAKVEINLGAGAVLDALAAAIPGKVDDAIFGLIKAALLGV